MLPLVHRRGWIAGAGIIVLAIVVGSLLPGPVVQHVGVFDKFEHAAAYFLLTAWVAGLYERRWHPAVAVAAFLLGGSMEAAQWAFTATRAPEALDLLANGAGIVGALGASFLGLGGWATWVERRIAGRASR